MKVKIREVQERDREDIVDIIGRVDVLTDEERRCAIEIMDTCLGYPHQDDYRLLCAADEGDRAIGYICYGKASLTDAVYELYWIIVTPPWQGKGIGRLLMQYLEWVLRGAKARLLTVETSSQPSYERARSFYERVGFCEVARIKDFYKMGDDKIIYSKQICSG